MSDSKREPHVQGVTCAICCHNSAERLAETLGALSAQVVGVNVPWEVLVIDNASSDDTAEVAWKSWTGPAELFRIVAEPVPGLSNARIRALSEARYSILSFIDDDNHVCPSWVATAFETMQRSEDIGIVGGRNLPLPETPPPDWFAAVQGFWAVENTPRMAGDMTTIEVFPSGAGLTLRTRAFQDLVDAGFQFTLTGRSGKGMGAGEDHELIMALMLRGWKVYHEPSMELKHFIPAGRLTWNYAMRLMRGVGEAGARMDAYLYLWMDRHGAPADALRCHWAWRAAASFRDWLALRAGAFSLGSAAKNKAQLLMAERAKGRFLALAQMRSGYLARKDEIAASSWLHIPDHQAI